MSEQVGFAAFGVERFRYQRYICGQVGFTTAASEDVVGVYYVGGYFPHRLPVLLLLAG